MHNQSIDYEQLLKTHILHEEHKEVYACLSEAIKLSDIELIKTLLENVSDLNLHNHQLIRHACLYFNVQILDLLISKGAVLNYDDNYFLKWAIEESNLEAINYFLDKGLTITLKNGEALATACSFNNYQVIHLLLERGANLDVETSNHFHNLRRIIHAGRLDNLKLMIDYGIHLEQYLDSVFTDAVVYDKADILIFLLDYAKEKELYISGKQLFLQACDFHHLSVINVLLQYHKNYMSDEAVRVSAERDDADLIALFIEHGADIEIAKKYGQEKVQHWLNSKIMFDQFNETLPENKKDKKRKI